MFNRVMYVCHEEDFIASKSVDGWTFSLIRFEASKFTDFDILELWNVLSGTQCAEKGFFFPILWHFNKQKTAIRVNNCPGISNYRSGRSILTISPYRKGSSGLHRNLYEMFGWVRLTYIYMCVCVFLSQRKKKRLSTVINKASFWYVRQGADFPSMYKCTCSTCR